MRLFLFIFLLFSCFFQVYSLDLPVSQISDDSLLRIRMKDSWFTETPNRVLSRRTAIELLESGERVQVSVIDGREEFMVILAREQTGGSIATDSRPAQARRGTGQFPGWAQGSWMLTRRKDTGAGTLIRIFLRSDQYTYIQFRHRDSEKSLMDIVLYGGFMVRSLPVAVPFERLLTMRLNDILKLVEEKIPLWYFEPDPQYYRNSRSFIAQVRQHLGDLVYTDDGAIDENGNFVFIETLQPQAVSSAGVNCSGFIKWLIDGILRPVTGKRLPITPLKAPFGDRGSSYTSIWEERRDPYFGLDWIRNLAAEANGTLRSASHRALEEFEVRSDNISIILVNENRTFVPHYYAGFLADAGYGFEGLHPLLYTLAIDDPFSFYLAAVNQEVRAPVTQTNPRGTPHLRQYFHVAALVPYFDEYGVFRVVVFESAAETSFSGFRNRYSGHNVNLVKIPVPSAFDP
ncbi:MAG: hypothetical protein LBI12_02075 [Treponema sp.]|jgi:hypothetical protein|nr:hypothetical protein [Treponema sp.]